MMRCGRLMIGLCLLASNILGFAPETVDAGGWHWLRQRLLIPLDEGGTGRASGTRAQSTGIASGTERPLVRIGSKTFTESVILGEILSQLAEHSGAEARHRDQLGGTHVLWKALLAGEIDVYPEYTGTITQEIFAGEGVSGEQRIREAVGRHKVRVSRPLGFSNNYALGMREPVAERLGVRTISDLKQHPELRFGFSNEFMSRADGWPKLQRTYELSQDHVRGLDHDLAYRGLESGSRDVIDLYTTDAEIKHYNLRVLHDDLSCFPTYKSVLLYRDDLNERAAGFVKAMLALEGKISAESMIAMNERAKLHRVPEKLVAAGFLEETFQIEPNVTVASAWSRFLKYTREHLFLVSISVAAAILVAVPLGILAARRRAAGQLILGAVGILQTVPSLALFVFLIPFLGLGAKPVICALFLYSLLPIVRNTHAGLHNISKPIHESAAALGLPPSARLRLIELPLAARSIMAGIKTSVVINVGTATLGALLGAGGYGEPIITGIRLDRTSLILEGAVPAALMALVAQGLFELIERVVVPRGLQLKSDA